MKYCDNTFIPDSYSRNIESGVETNDIKSNDLDSYYGFKSQEQYEKVLKIIERELFWECGTPMITLDQDSHLKVYVDDIVYSMSDEDDVYEIEVPAKNPFVTYSDLKILRILNAASYEIFDAIIEQEADAE